MKSNSRIIVFIVSCTLLNCAVVRSAIAQEERKLTREGNKEFNKGNYADAEASYKKALDKKNNFPEAIFNLGDAIYKQDNRKEEAGKFFDLAAKTFTNNNQKAKAYHNLGNSFLSSDNYQEAVNAYKQALKLNPNDKDTKYNLAYALAKLKQQQQQNQNQNNKQDQKQDKDKKDQQQKKPDSNENKDDKNKGENKENKDKNKDQGQQPQPKLSKEAADKLLQALQNEEQKTQEKMNKKQARPVEVKIEKDW